ncbi:MAG: TRAP transporter substrate-binding protein DctP [Burkholderiaceae bacterium]|nr:TRAP transporter substrate-binding protein DctP [Burkholderiaceae bacterium]
MNRSLATLIAAAALTPALPALAQVKLKVADSLPATHYISIHGAKKFMDEATRLSGGKLSFEYYPTEQLGKAKDFLQLTLSGVTDIAYIAPAYAPDKLPLSAVAELPGMFTSSCEGTAAYWKQVKDGFLYEREFKPNGLKPLFAFALAPYQISTKSAPLAKFDDLKGLKIRGAGGAMDLTLRSLGAVSVRMAAPEIRESLMRGTIDGSVGPAGSSKPYGLDTQFKFMTVGASFGGFVGTYSMSLKKWESLPADVQQALAAAGEEANKSICAIADQQEAAAVTEMEGHGAKPWRLNAAEKAELSKRLEPVHEDWAKRMDERKLPGTEAIKSWRAASGRS